MQCLESWGSSIFLTSEGNLKQRSHPLTRASPTKRHTTSANVEGRRKPPAGGWFTILCTFCGGHLRPDYLAFIGERRVSCRHVAQVLKGGNIAGRDGLCHSLSAILRQPPIVSARRLFRVLTFAGRITQVATVRNSPNLAQTAIGLLTFARSL